MKIKFGEEMEQHLVDQQPSPVRTEFLQFGVNSCLKWRGSRLAASKLQSLSPFLLLKASGKRPMKAKKYYVSINISLNFIKILRPRCNSDMQFTGFYS